MKHLPQFLMVLILSICLGCSSSDDSDGGSQLPSENSFSVTIDGQLYTFDTFFAFKTHDNYEVLGQNSNQENFFMRFNQNGVLDRANFYIIDGTLDNNYNSSFYNAKHNFTISNLAFDTSQNIVSADISGIIYEEDISIYDGDSREVESGSFNLAFTENIVDPNLDIFIDATVNGELYETMKHGTSSNGSSIEQQFGVSDNTLVMSIDLDTNNVQIGTFDFDSSTNANRVSVNTSDPFNLENDYEELSVTGTLIIDNIIEGVAFDLIQGSFSATATSDSGTVYNIENGTFNVSL